MKKEWVQVFLGLLSLLAISNRTEAGMTGDQVTGILHTFAAGSWENSSATVTGGIEFRATYHAGGTTEELTLDIADDSFTLKYVNNIAPKPGNDGSFNLGLDGFEFTDPNQHFAGVTFVGSTGGFPNDSITQTSVTDHNVHIFMNEPIIPGLTIWTATWKISFAPKLSIIRSGQDVIVSWPDDATGYTLQQKSGSMSANWADVSTSVHHAAFPVTSSVQFFRLIKL